MTGRAFWTPLAARLRAVLADEQKRVKLLVLMGLAGLALLAVSAWLPAESTAPPAVQGESTADYAAQLDKYAKAMRALKGVELNKAITKQQAAVMHIIYV